MPRIETLGAKADGSLMDKARAASPEFRDVERTHYDLAAFLYTSNYRRPKTPCSATSTCINADILRNSCCSLRERLLHALPFLHPRLFVATNVTLMAGASLIFLPSFNADEIIRLLPEATVMMACRPSIRAFCTQGLYAGPRQAHTPVRFGSAPLSAETHMEFETRTGHAILERYGMTETNMNTSNPYDGDRIPGSVGFPLPGVEIRIADPETGRVLPQGEVGGIEIRGPNVFKGYWRMPEKTKEEFRPDGFFVSGDLGRIDERGYIAIVGRAKDLIISGGFNVYPAEVEAIIEALPGVAECAVIGVPHADFGEAVVAVVTAKAGAALEEKTIQAALANELAKFKQPKKVFVTTELPRNAMGKVQKKDLRAEHAKTFTT